MNVGILTFHLAHNYGAVLQCYALQEVLRDMGCEAMVINYQQPFIADYFKPQMNMGIRSFCKACWRGKSSEYLYRGLLPYIKTYHFKTFRKKYLRLTKQCYNVTDIPVMDLYIVGSDQPWNPDLTNGADLVYWGQFERPATSQLATYAMSGSEKAIAKVGWNNVKQYCTQFNSLSFREEYNTKIFKNLTGKVCQTVLDPTLLADANLWSPLLNKKWAKRQYVLLYHVGGPKSVIDTMVQKAKAMANTEGLDFIDASRYLYSPADFVSLIYYARCVVTASFHALAFSIMFQKPFCAVRTGQASDIRLKNLLEATRLTTHFVEASEVCIPVKLKYAEAEENLNILREVSIKYLQSLL